MRFGLAALALLGFAASAPPAWIPGAEFLVFLGLGAFYALSGSSRRPHWLAYGMGLGYMLAFSFSLRHVLWLGYVAVGVVGGVYFVLAVAWTRGLRTLLGGPLAFGCAIAATAWLRAEMPDFSYPHGQPCHALYRWPALLGSVTLGGEVLANLLLAGLAAACVDVWSAWRLAIPAWRGAVRTLIAFATVSFATTLVGSWLAPREQPSGPQALQVVAIEPGFRALFQLEGSYLDALVNRLVRPTEAALAGVGTRAPDLVVWPESCYPRRAREASGGIELEGEALELGLREGTSLLAGADLLRRADGKTVSLALLVDARGHLLGWHEKRRPVPAGERIPLLWVLPTAWREELLAAIRARMGYAPDLEPGRPRPPLAVPVRTEQGARAQVLVGALLCFDNAFPSVARELVANGSRLLVVLSNEAWYRGGDELDQLEAMTVMRCLETRSPCLRCTVDGNTVLVDGHGRVQARIARGASETAPKVLEAAIPLGAGALPPLSWLHPVVLGLVLASALGWLRHAPKTWARLVAARSPRSG